MDTFYRESQDALTACERIRQAREAAAIRASIERGDPLAIRQGYPHPIAYTYGAAYHCPVCTARAFGVDESGFPPESARDGEGNPIGAVAPWDEWEECGEPGPYVLTCDTCLGEIERHD